MNIFCFYRFQVKICLKQVKNFDFEFLQCRQMRPSRLWLKQQFKMVLFPSLASEQLSRAHQDSNFSIYTENNQPKVKLWSSNRGGKAGGWRTTSKMSCSRLSGSQFTQNDWLLNVSHVWSTCGELSNKAGSVGEKNDYEFTSNSRSSASSSVSACTAFTLEFEFLLHSYGTLHIFEKWSNHVKNNNHFLLHWFTLLLLSWIGHRVQMASRCSHIKFCCFHFSLCGAKLSGVIQFRIHGKCLHCVICYSTIMALISPYQIPDNLANTIMKTNIYCRHPM